MKRDACICRLTESPIGEKIGRDSSPLLAASTSSTVLNSPCRKLFPFCSGPRERRSLPKVAAALPSWHYLSQCWARAKPHPQSWIETKPIG